MSEMQAVHVAEDEGRVADLGFVEEEELFWVEG